MVVNSFPPENYDYGTALEDLKQVQQTFLAAGDLFGKVLDCDENKDLPEELIAEIESYNKSELVSKARDIAFQNAMYLSGSDILGEGVTDKMFVDFSCSFMNCWVWDYRLQIILRTRGYHYKHKDGKLYRK